MRLIKLRHIVALLVAAAVLSALALGNTGAKYQSNGASDLVKVVWSTVDKKVYTGGVQTLSITDGKNDGYYAYMIWGACGGNGQGAGTGTAHAESYGNGGYIAGIAYLNEAGGPYVIAVGDVGKQDQIGSGGWPNNLVGGHLYGDVSAGDGHYATGAAWASAAGGGGYSGLFNNVTSTLPSGASGDTMPDRAIAVAGGGGGGGTQMNGASAYGTVDSDGSCGFGGDGGTYGIGSWVDDSGPVEIKGSNGGSPGYSLHNGAGGGTEHTYLSGMDNVRNGAGVYNWGTETLTSGGAIWRHIFCAGSSATGAGGGSLSPFGGGGGGGYEGGGAGGYHLHKPPSDTGGGVYATSFAFSGGGGGGSTYARVSDANYADLPQPLKDYLNAEMTKAQTSQNAKLASHSGYDGLVVLIYLGSERPDQTNFIFNW